ncbi:2,3-dihydroxyphenylpropionate/2,3-dihydroxicinnamic acid 1,2-dioxygenase [Xylophilus ampelinus]|nr:2,3-dihydroxyphenylpropionate/2,3-dihydroxicinnamic acid 1,2-dioxygenase [Xylophilus ampelinus]
MTGAIVFAAGVSHAPYITGMPDHAPPESKARFYAAMEEIGVRMRAARPDVVVVVSSDHFHNLFTDRMPAFCVGLGDSHEGPAEKWIRIEPFNVKGAAAFGRAVMHHAFRLGMDPAFSQRMVIEHGLAVPLSFLTPSFDIPVLPILQNCMVPPLPPLRRCYALGQVLRAAAQEQGLRVAVVGTGGLSHAPGSADAGRIDSEFDREFLEMLRTRPMDALAISDERMDAAGFGTWEIRQWITALGAAGGGSAEVLAYEAVEAWETGCGAAVFAVEK